MNRRIRRIAGPGDKCQIVITGSAIILRVPEIMFSDHDDWLNQILEQLKLRSWYNTVRGNVYFYKEHAMLETNVEGMWGKECFHAGSTKWWQERKRAMMANVWIYGSDYLIPAK